jgi:multidrug efflux pump subunit AcrA (membrane-fusion protein)
MIVCYSTNNQWHAATSQGLIAYGLPSEAALKAAISRAVDGDFAIEYATPEVWRSTMLAAVAADTLAAQSFIDSSDQSREVDRLRAQLSMVLEAVETLNAELAAEGERAKAEEARRQAAAAEAKRRAALIEQQRKAAAEQQRQAEAEALRKLDRRAVRVGDVVEVTENTRVEIGRDTHTVRRVVGRYKANEVPPEVAALL